MADPSRSGTDGYFAVYHCAQPRLAQAMLLIAAALAASMTQAVPDRQAVATVRIIRVEPVHFAEIERARPKELRSTVVRGVDGRPEPARLLEYQ